MKTKTEMALEVALERNYPVCNIGGTGLWAWEEWAQPILQPRLGPWPTPKHWKLLGECFFQPVIQLDTSSSISPKNMLRFVGEIGSLLRRRK